MPASPVISQSIPVSSFVSRTAACIIDSPRSMEPPGTAQFWLSERRMSKTSPAALVTTTLTHGTRLYLRSRYDRDATRHKPGSYQKSGDVECQSQLVWWPNYIKQSFKRAAEVGDRLFLRRAIANRAYAGAELGRGAPNTVLILLDDVGHVNDTSHTFSIA